MKKICALAFALVFAISAWAQSGKGCIYLKNGTILKGKYKYSEDLSRLTLQSRGNLWVFESEMIDTITSFEARRFNEIQTQSTIASFFFRTEVGVLAGNSDNSQTAPLSFTGSANYSFYKKFSAGIGTGIEFFKESYLPVFLNLEYKIRSSHSTPYFFLKGGYQVPLEESRTIYYDNYYPEWSSFRPWPNYYPEENMESKGGILINPGMGYQRMFSSTFGMTFAFGYQFHRLHYTGANDYGLDIDYNRLSIKLGIIFN